LAYEPFSTGASDSGRSQLAILGPHLQNRIEAVEIMTSLTIFKTRE
jgi:hypothetical protein